MMKEAIDLLVKILTNILTALYQPCGFSLLLSFLAMFFYLYAYESATAGKGWKSAVATWYKEFKGSVFFRKLFLLAFVTGLILFKTLLNRNLWMNPLSDIMGGGLVLVGNLIRDQLLKVRDWNVGSAMSMILIVLSAGIYLLYRKVGGDDLGVM